MSYRDDVSKLIDSCDIRYEHEQVYAAPLNVVWNTFSETDQIGKLLQLEAAKVVETPLREGVSSRQVTWDSMGQTFLEEPYVWEYGQWYANVRKEGQGPLKVFAQMATFQEVEGGIRVRLRYGYQPHTSFKGLFFRVLYRMSLRPLAVKVFENIDFNAECPMPLHQCFPIHQERLDALKAVWAERFLPEVIGLMADHLSVGLDPDLANMGPFELAQRWKKDPDDILEMCLMAVRHGFMELQWSLLCPKCQGAKAQVNALNDLDTGAHCDSCNITFGSRFSENVQVSFRPQAALRELEEGFACVSGPRRTPHQLQNVYLEPKETFSPESTELFDTPDRLVLRTDEGNLFRELHEAAHYSIGDEQITVSPGPFCVENTTDRRVRAVIQRDKIPSYTLTAAELIRRQTFVDYFSEHVLAPDLKAEVGTVTLMFSDLVGSTKLYREAGDAGAFTAVREHFSILKEVLNAHRGTLIKTVGDAIMAIFNHPEDAVACAIAMQHRMQKESDLGLRLGLHVGPCLAVTLNDRLDYFGGTVNQAARMEGQCLPGQIVLSDPLRQDPEVTKFIEDGNFPLGIDHVEVKGIDVPLTIWRLDPGTHS